MGLKAGTLLWNRKTIELAAGSPPATNDVDTELAQQNTSFPDYSPNEPRIDAHGVLGPPPADIGSRIQVIPMAPLSAWALVTHDEPRLDITDPANPKIRVLFNAGPNGALITVLFWDPHSLIGPGDADLYQGID